MTLQPPSPPPDSGHDAPDWYAAYGNRSGPAQAPAPLVSCPPELLASLGPLLCLHRVSDAHVLSGYSAARSVHACVTLDSEGPCEALLFFDASRRPCWRLYLLPDSDYLAWERAVACLARTTGRETGRPVFGSGLAPVRRLLRNPLWHACPLRLHAVSATISRRRLAASEVTLSEAGWQAAQRIARSEGADTIVRPNSMD